MADFRCRLATPNGEILERDYQAEDPSALRRELERQDIVVLSIQRRSQLLTAFTGMFRRRRRVGIDEFLFFNQEFAALVRAGLPIVECLGLLIERRKNPIFRQALINVRDRVRQGEALSDAFAAQGLFPPLYASTLSSGERSGEIATVLQRYVSYTKTILSVRRKVIAALVYPAVLTVMSILLVGVLVVYVLPKFEEFFKNFGADLFWLTKFLLSLSGFVRNQWWLWILVAIGGSMFFSVWRRTPRGQRLLEKTTYRVPIIGTLAHKFVITRYARTLGTLVAGGIPLVTCLEAVTRAIGTPLFSDATLRVTARVREGAALWSSLDETKLFPDMMVEMVKVGESSGTVAEMLDHVANFTDQEIEHDLQTLTSLIEPLLLVAMAVIVGSLLLAIYYPLLQVYAKAGVWSRPREPHHGGT